MGRAIVRQPKVFLMDEPLSNLDAKLRVQTRARDSPAPARLGVTTFYVTHDQVEAMTMADRVAVINAGCSSRSTILRCSTTSPDNTFVATFIGSPSMSLVEAILEGDGAEGLSVWSVPSDCRCPRRWRTSRPALRNYVGRKLVLGLRPDAMEDAALLADHPADRRLRGEVDAVEALGLSASSTSGSTPDRSSKRTRSTSRHPEAVAASKAGARLSGRFDPAKPGAAG